MITNRRKFHRIPVEEQCSVTIDGATLQCTLVDQSINGAKIAGLDFLLVPYGKLLSITQDGDTFEAIIRGVTRSKNNEMLVGIERVEAIKDEVKHSQAMLVNCFIRHEGSLMVCIPICMEPDGKVRIRLWDGMEFPIAYSSLVTLNRRERYESLLKGSNLTMIAELYGLSTTPLSKVLDAIFDFEFGHIASCNVKESFAKV